MLFSFFAQCLQTFEIQIHKNLSAKKIKKTYRNICICQIFDIPLSSGSGKKPERTTNFIHLLNFFIMKHISKNSQKGMNYLHSFDVAKAKNINCLEKVYTHFSNYKCAAFRACEQKRLLDDNAISLGYIISSNSNYFTYAYMTKYGLCVETYCNSYIVE